jgi:tellurite resistance protein
MSIFDWLSGGSDRAAAQTGGGSRAVREIVERLAGMTPETARWVASFAMVLARAARADLAITGDEREAMAALLASHGGLEPERALLVAEMAAHRNELLGPSEDYLAAREFRRVAGPGDAQRLLHCLFAVTAADDSISLREEEEIRQIATELGIEHAGFTAVRALFREKRAVLRDRGHAG